MPPLDAVAQEWFRWIVPASWQLALLVAVVALVSWATRTASPRLRYALWLLVLVKVFLPPSLTAVWGVGHWGLSPLWVAAQPVVPQFLEGSQLLALPTDLDTVRPDTFPTASHLAANTAAGSWPLESLLFFAWFGGAVLFSVVVLWKYRRLVRSTASLEQIDEGPLRIRLEKIAAQLGESQVPDLFISPTAASPFLYGVLRPAIVLPQQVAQGLCSADINNILLHELIHWRRRDPWIGWVQVASQSLFWFHPLVWWANARLRHERECVCDEAVLRSGECEPDGYGQALLSVISLSGGRSQVHGSLVGVFERATNIQIRLEEIMGYQSRKRKFGLLSLVAIGAFAVVFLPMGLPRGIAQQQAEETVAVESQVLASQPKVSSSVGESRLPPRMVASTPRAGQTDVDPKLDEISVTFDRDMQKGGMSWTGGPPFFPPAHPHKKPYWRDNRTCVLPMQIKKGQIYRVGINSTSFQNFRSSRNEPAIPTAVFFTTRGASKKLQQQVKRPKIVKLVPANGATDVDPNLKALRVTFDMPMGGGMSWTGGGKHFPTITDGKKPRWSKNGRTCVLPVTLQPDWRYEIGLNSLHHINFSSKWGVPLEPVVYRFHTSSTSTRSSEASKSGTDSRTKRMRYFVENFFQDNFRDVKQRQTVEWGPVTRDDEGNWSIQYKYSAKIWDKNAMMMLQVFTFTPDGEFVGWYNSEGYPQELEEDATE